jgi:hypothetical protein
MKIDILEGLRLFAAYKRMKMRNPQNNNFSKEFSLEILWKNIDGAIKSIFSFIKNTFRATSN